MTPAASNTGKTGPAIERIAEIFGALSAGSRLRILLTLTKGRTTVSEIVQATGLSQPLISQHLKTLRGLRLVRVQRNGREAFYSLEDTHVMDMIQDALAHATEDDLTQ